MFQGSKNATGEYFALRREGRRQHPRRRRQRHHQHRPHQLLRDRAVGATSRTLLWLESDRLATLDRRHRSEEARQPARRRQERAPPGPREHALRPRVQSLIFENRRPRPATRTRGRSSAARRTSPPRRSTTSRTFFRRYYTPNNLSLVIAGDFDPAEAKRLVEKYFGGIPPGPALDRPRRWVPKLERRDASSRSADRVPAASASTWPGRRPSTSRRTMRRSKWRRAILVDGLSSRLNKALVYDQPLATEVVGVQTHVRDLRACSSCRRPRAPASPLAKIEKIVTAEIARLAKDGPDAGGARSRARRSRSSSSSPGLERIGGFGGKADVLNQYNTFLGDPGKVDADISRYRALTPPTSSGRVARWLDTPNRADRPLPSRGLEASGRRDDARPLEDAAARRRPAVRRADGADREARERPRGLRRRARTTCRRSNVTLVDARRRGRRSRRQGRRRQPDDGGPSTWARRRARRCRSRTRLGDLGITLGGGAGREMSTRRRSTC